MALLENAPRRNGNKKLEKLLGLIIDSNSESAKIELSEMKIKGEDLVRVVEYLNDYKHLYKVELEEKKRLKEGVIEILENNLKEYSPTKTNEINDFLNEF